jgi:hypothetical protein
MAGTALSEYRTLVTLALATYDPDLALISFFRRQRWASFGVSFAKTSSA